MAMTLDELNSYWDCIRDLESARALQTSLSSAAVPGAQVLTGMPHAPGYSDKLGELVPAMLDLSDTIASLEDQKAQREAEIVSFIQTIPEFRIRTMFSLRFLRGMSWKGVAAVMGGQNTIDGVKSACYRYLKSCNAVTRRDA
ncbi:MAG: hypothetical protein IJT94_06940 [Oscillibacter sp.]|nr:hypothetical protein [Oscillibacter sp.]